MKPYVIVKYAHPIIHNHILSNLEATAYNIYELSHWEEAKTFLESYDRIIATKIGVNEAEKNMGSSLLFHDNGPNVLSAFTITKISQHEYDTFVNFMPTYFGECSIFDKIEELMSEV